MDKYEWMWQEGKDVELKAFAEWDDMKQQKIRFYKINPSLEKQY